MSSLCTRLFMVFSVTYSSELHNVVIFFAKSEIVYQVKSLMLSIVHLYYLIFVGNERDLLREVIALHNSR